MTNLSMLSQVPIKRMQISCSPSVLQANAALTSTIQTTDGFKMVLPPDLDAAFVAATWIGPLLSCQRL